MKDMGIVQGSAAQAVPLVIGKDTVYFHTDIKKIDTDPLGNPTDNFYQYHEVQYEKDEYIQLMANNLNAIIPYTDTKTLCVGDKEITFYDVPEGNVTVFFPYSYTMERISNRLELYFDPLEDITEITISIV